MFIKLQYHWYHQKGTDSINEVSRLKNDNSTVRPGIHVHVSCRRNYIRTPGVPSSSAKVSYRKTRTSSGEREKKTKKSCNVSCKIQEVDKAVHQAIFDRKNDKWSTEVKGRFACVNDLGAEDTVYHVQYSSNFQTGKDNPKKSVFP